MKGPSSSGRPEWSVLTKSVGPGSSPAPTQEQTDRLLALLPGVDKWTQYPPASGRGHAFETRFWVPAGDASEAAEVGVGLVSEAQAAVGLGDWRIVRLHSASLAERAIEHYPGLEERAVDAPDWSVMHRSTVPAGEPPVDDDERTRLLVAIDGPDRIVGGAGRLVELRFWVPGADAVDAARTAETAVAAAMHAIGRASWTTIRVQTASVAERRREVYLGAERRLREAGGA